MESLETLSCSQDHEEVRLLELGVTSFHRCRIHFTIAGLRALLPIPMTRVSHEVVDFSIKKLLIALVGLKFQSIEQGPHCART